MRKQEQAQPTPNTIHYLLPTPLLNEYQAAIALGVSVATLRRRRISGQPPAWLKIGASVRYKPESIQALIAASERGVEV